MTSRFVGLFDGRRRDQKSWTERLPRALDHVHGRSLATGSLVLAWADAVEPSGEPLGFLDGSIYAGLPAPDAASAAAFLAAQFRRHGDAVLDALRGDFLFLYYDAVTEEAVFARDQLGGRALYWHEHNGRLTFASEVRYLLPFLETRPEPDPEALAHWLALSGQPPDRTAFAGIRRLEEGALLRVGGGFPVSRRYWNPQYRQPADRSADECAAELRAALSQAVGRRSTGAPATAVLLSGGLDSSTVAATAVHLDKSRRPNHAYSATFPDHPAVDEGELIVLTCARLGLESTRAVVSSGSVIAGAFSYLDHWQLPPPSPNLFFWLPLLRRAAADGVRVLLDGEGGDELFGLSPYLMADRLRHGRVRSAAALARRLPGGRPDLPRSAIRPFLREYGLKGAAPNWLHRALRRRRSTRRYAPPWLLPELRSAYMDTDVTGTWKQLGGPRWWSYLVAASTRGMGAPVTYDHVRRRAALVGLEPRHPLVDVDVIEAVLSFPPERAFDTRFSRPLLRVAMQDWVPDEVRLRPGKSFFDAMFHEALVGDLDLARALLDPATAQLRPYVDLALVGSELLTAAPPPGERLDWAQQLWRLLTAECWLRAQQPGGLAALELPVRLAADVQIRTGA